MKSTTEINLSSKEVLEVLKVSQSSFDLYHNLIALGITKRCIIYVAKLFKPLLLLFELSSHVSSDGVNYEW